MTSLDQSPPPQANTTHATLTVDRTCGVFEGSLSPVLDDVEPIEQEMQKIDDQMIQLRERKAFLALRVNSIRSPTRVLPPEVLSAIFKYASISQDFRNRLTIKLGSVCSHWRQVVLSTPELWATLRLYVVPRYTPRNVAILQLSLQHAGKRPLSLTFSFKKESSPRHFRAITDLVFGPEIRGRIKAIRSDNTPAPWMPFFSKGFPNLEALSIDGVNGVVHPAVILTRMPRLRQLSLDPSSQRITISLTVMNSITTLSLGSVHVDTWEKLISNSPNLIECYCRGIQDDDISPNSTISTIVLPFLKVLVWPAAVGYSTLLRHLRLPSLQKLTLREIGRPRTFERREECLIEFFAHLPPTVQNIELRSLHYKSVLAQLFSRVHKLEELLLLECSVHFIRDAVQLLARGGADTTASPGLQYLPCLQTLSITGLSDGYLELLPEVVERRERLGLKLASVREYLPGVSANDGLKSFVEKLANEGRNIRYISDPYDEWPDHIHFWRTNL